MRSLAALAVAALLAACGGSGSRPAEEAVGLVDTSFGVQGVVRLPGEGFIEDILELPDGSLLVAGGPGFVAKLTEAGALDRTFAGGGIDATRYGTHVYQRTVGLEPFPQGAVTVLALHTSPCPGGGFCNPASGDVVVRRIDANGFPDLAYGIDGRSHFGRVTPVSQVVFPSGRVVTFDMTGGRTETFFGVTSINAMGAGDGFGDTARETINACGRVLSPSGFFRPSSVGAVAQGEKTIVVALWGGPAGGACFLRLTPELRTDVASGPGAFVTAVPSAAARSLGVLRVMLRDDGAIVVALGRLVGTTPPIFLFFTSDGQFSEQAAPAAPTFMLDALLQPNGKVLSAGFPARSPGLRELPYDAARPQLWRASRGADVADTSFGESGAGFVPIASGSLLIEPRRVRVDRAGRILVGGQSMATREPALIRFR